VEQETTFRGDARKDPNVGGCLATGMRAVSAIPILMTRPPGLCSALEVGIGSVRGAIRADTLRV
jgi:4-hydroxy-tetrahydrodipicolinate reductase